MSADADIAQPAAAPAAQVRPILAARPVDGPRAVAAATDLLRALGLDVTEPGLADTPRRLVDMLAERLTPQPLRPTVFDNDAGYDELVLVGSIPFTSLCEHHLLPFRGVAHVGYLPADRILGLSKFARVVDAFSRRPQVQERLTTQVADWLDCHLQPRGVGVVLDAEHLCMTIRGVQAAGARTVTSALYGHLRDNASAREEFLALARQSP